MLTDKFANTALCQHSRFNNQPCGQPALRGRKFCRFHQTAHRKRPDYSLPMVEDAISLQFALMQVIRALHDRAIDPKTAAITLYGLQIASGNLKRFLEEHSPSTDSARENSLFKLFLDQFQDPRTFEDEADFFPDDIKENRAQPTRDGGGGQIIPGARLL
jgi:hypothetical protein